MSILAWAAKRKHHRRGSLKGHLFLTFLEAGKYKIKVKTDLYPGKDFLSGLQTAPFSLCP